jgi:hypothetical protein
MANNTQSTNTSNNEVVETTLVKAQNTIDNTLIKYFGEKLANKRDNVHTDLADVKIVGSAAHRNMQIPTMVSVTLKADKRNNNHLMLINKAVNGVLSLNVVFPFQHVDFNTMGNGIQTDTVFVQVSASSGQYQRVINANNPDLKGIANSNGNLTRLASIFESKVLNGATIIGSVIDGWIPRLGNVYSLSYHDTINGETIGVINAINRITLNIWNRIKSIEESDLVEADKQNGYKAEWDKYLSFFEAWKAHNYIDVSNVIYAVENSIEPVCAAFLGTRSSVPELDTNKVYGTINGSSYVPKTNRIFACGVISGASRSENGKFEYGVFKAGRGEDRIVLEDQDEISKTVEICTKELYITDGIGREVTIQVKARDIQYGVGSRPIKLSRRLANEPVGSMLQLNGTLKFRPVREKSQAVKFEVELIDHQTYGSQTNAIVGNIETSDSIIFTNDGDAYLDFDLDMLSANDNKSNVVSDMGNGINIESGQSDSDMNT